MRTFLLSVAAAATATGAELTVTTADDIVDAGDGLLSLREAIADASPGDDIVFDFALDGATITTTGGTLVFDKSLTVDATDLPAGIRLDAELNHRLLDVQSGTSVTVIGLSLLNGRTTNPERRLRADLRQSHDAPVLDQRLHRRLRRRPVRQRCRGRRM